MREDKHLNNIHKKANAENNSVPRVSSATISLFVCVVNVKFLEYCYDVFSPNSLRDLKTIDDKALLGLVQHKGRDAPMRLHTHKPNRRVKKEDTRPQQNNCPRHARSFN
jgi:hypothetical protein